MEKRVEDIELRKGMSIDELIGEMKKGGGFVAKKLAVAVDIVERMLKDKECFTFLSFPACVVATGVRGVIKDMVKNGWIDAIVTTCGTLDHDLARVWRDYLQGSFSMNDIELHRKGINRLGNIIIPMDSYGKILEEKMQPILKDLYKLKKRWSTRDIIWEFGKRLEDEDGGRDSIMYWAWKKRVPMFIPGIMDGAFGSQLWQFYQDHRDFAIDLLKDSQELSEIVFSAKKSGAIIVGGGISKHHVVWWNQFRDGLDYAIYLTTAVEYNGSLSGAQTREAISWGKIKEEAEHVTVEGDATITLPLIVGALKERL